MLEIELQRRRGRARGRILLGAALCWLPATAWAGPDFEAAGRTLVSAPPALAGTVLGGAGLAAAATIAGLGDLASLLDAHKATRPLLRGLLSRTLHRLALATSWTMTGALEGLRSEDIERLPEARSTYLQAAPGVGRLDTLLTGAAALRLALRDLLWLPPRLAAELGGARNLAARIRQWDREARIAALGPDPLPAPPAAGEPTSAPGH